MNGFPCALLFLLDTGIFRVRLCPADPGSLVLIVFLSFSLSGHLPEKLEGIGIIGSDQQVPYSAIVTPVTLKSL